MKKKIYIAGLGLAFLAGGLFAGTGWLSANTGNLEGPLTAVGANPGSAEDPLVAVSYLDMRIAELEQAFSSQAAAGGQVNAEAIVNEVLADIAGFFGTSGSGGDTSFTPVHVNEGQVIMGGEGVEIIRRSGAAVANVPGQDGIVNVSAGLDLDHGHPIPANHLLIIPREDGRGIRATRDSWFMIRGEFTITTP